jgi:ABC-2 type transport system permease protein
VADSVKLYGMIVAKEARRFFTYRGNIFSGCFSGLLILAVRYALWTALFAAGHTQDVSLRETMTYFVITDVLLVWRASYYGATIGADIRSGDIAQRLIRPFPYQLQLVAAFHARAVSETLTRTLPMLAAAVIFIGLSPPSSLAAFIIFILAVIMGAAIFGLVDLTISYTAFWLTDYWYLSWVRRALFTLFGGLMLPLWFYPDWLRTISGFLPFQFAVFIPIEIYLGRIYGGAVISALAMQLFWIAVLFVCERGLWRMLQHKLAVQGG